ncbi:MAG: SIS domain-containing protein, partial [Emcibacteraceae bacterium]|nr:SIS domain-containing protein [Emcibacteraceae bacterium]
NSVISAIGNDYGYEQVFSRELQAIAKPGDVFIPISTSGNSSNIIAAVEIAEGLGISVVGLTGQSGGRLKKICECLCVPSLEVPRIQECHIIIGHILCRLVEAKYFDLERFVNSNEK